MAYDERTAERIRRLLARESDVREQRMMGGLIFMVKGSMCCGISERGLMVRVGADHHAAACKEPHVRPMEIGGGRKPKGFVRVDPAGYASDAALKAWVKRGLAFVKTLPAKKARKRAKAR
jgi:TfoX/Sxy family transcriptional regulator of competence genes